MNVSIGKHLESYIEWQLKNGPFNSASEIVRDALRMHQLKYTNIYSSDMEPPSGEDLSKWRNELHTPEEKSDKSA